MNTIHLTDEELEMARHALHAYLQAFGHGEADTLVKVKALAAKLDRIQPVEPDPERRNSA